MAVAASQRVADSPRPKRAQNVGRRHLSTLLAAIAKFDPSALVSLHGWLRRVLGAAYAQPPACVLPQLFLGVEFPQRPGHGRELVFSKLFGKFLVILRLALDDLHDPVG